MRLPLSSPSMLPVIRALTCSAALVFAGCALPGKELGIDDVTRITFEASLPLRASFPPADLAPADEDFAYAFTVPVPIDVLAMLRAQGRDEDVATIEAQRDKLEAVVLDRVEYEIVEPNELPADVEPVVVYFGPPGAARPDATTREVGRTAAIPARESRPVSELIYTGTGRADAAELMEALRFTVLFDTSVLVPRAQPVEGGALDAKVRLRITVRIDLAG